MDLGYYTEVRYLQKFLTFAVLVALLTTNIIPSALADEDFAVHSLDELPGSQMNTKSNAESEEKTISYEVSSPSEDIVSLIAAKQAFETEQKQSMLAVPSIASLLEQNSTLWGMNASISADNFLAPQTDAITPIIETFFPALDFGFAQSGGVFPHSTEKAFRVSKETKLGDNTHGIFGKTPTQIKLAPETIVTAADGSLIDPATIGISESDTVIASKANGYHDKKKKGTKAKGYATNNANIFDFGIPGKHLLFSKPVEISVYTPNFTDGIIVDIATLHAGDTEFHTNGLSTIATTACNTDGTATVPGSSAVVKNGKVTFYACGASSYTMNPTGGVAGSNDLRLVIGDCGQFQLYYNGTANMYTGTPPATACNATLDSWFALRIANTTYWSEANNWTSRTTVGSQSGNTYSGTTTLTRTVGGRTHRLLLNWVYTAPNKYFNINWTMIIPTGNTNNVRFYIGNDSMVGGNDANDVGYSGSAPSQTLGVYDNVLDQLSAIRYISGWMWTAGEAGPYTNIRTRINGGADFNNTIQGAPGDLGFGVDWNLGTTPGTYTGTIEWRVAPFVSGDVPDVISGIGQPTPALTVGQISTLPMSVTNVGNTSSTGVHTLVMGIPANILGPSTSFTDNGWSCGAQVGTGVTCTKTLTLAPLGTDTVNIPVIPEVAASGTTVRFTARVSNAGDSNLTNNTSFVDLQVVVAPAPPDSTKPVITGTSIASGALIPSGNFTALFSYYDTGSNINVDTTTGAIYSWNTGSSTWNVMNLAPSYMTIANSTVNTGTFQITNLPFGKYRFDFSTRDNQGNTSTGSFTYFVDAIEWTISADTYNIGNIPTNTTTFGTGELTVTIRTVGAGFTLTTLATSNLVNASSDIINYWNGTIGWGYDQWNGSAYPGTLTTQSPTATLANIPKNINQSGQKNTFTYRIKNGAKVQADQATGDYSGMVNFGLNLTY